MNAPINVHFTRGSSKMHIHRVIHRPRAVTDRGASRQGVALACEKRCCDESPLHKCPCPREVRRGEADKCTAAGLPSQ